MPNTYRIILIDFDETPTRSYLLKHVNGLNAARAAVPVPLIWSKNARVFTAWKGRKNYIVEKV